MSTRKKKKSAKQIVAKISSLAEEFIDNQKNANNIVDILEYLQTNRDPVILTATIKASCKVSCHLISKYYSWLVPAGTKLTSTHASTTLSLDDNTKKYRQWMRENYFACVESLQELLCYTEPEVRWLALTSLLSLIQSEGFAHQRLSRSYIFPNTFFHVIVSHLLSKEEDTSDLISRFQEYLKYDDVRFYWLKNIASILNAKIDGKTRAVKLSDVFVTNVHYALNIVSMPTSEKDIGQYLTGTFDQTCDHDEVNPSDEEQSDKDGDCDEGEDKPPRPKKRRKQLNITSLRKHRKQFSDAWLAFLRLPLSSRLYKKVLTSLHSDVMPHLLDPRLLLDFLSYSYNAGGVVSLLALNGLFILMHEYHLDYPDFYKKLYGLLEPSVFHVKYMRRFFILLDTFLLSTHLPLYLVAAFAKRIARLALTAPPNGVMVAVVFVINLLKRHPNCRVLVHRKNAGECSFPSGEDPYDVVEDDPANCNALESSLWEFETLKSHFLPAVSKLVKDMLTPETVYSEVELDLNKYLEIDDNQLFEEVCTKKIEDTADIPINTNEPASLWKPGELCS